MGIHWAVLEGLWRGRGGLSWRGLWRLEGLVGDVLLRGLLPVVLRLTCRCWRLRGLMQWVRLQRLWLAMLRVELRRWLWCLGRLMKGRRLLHLGRWLNMRWVKLRWRLMKGRRLLCLGRWLNMRWVKLR